MSRVSVIVPAYNEERFLPRSLGSLRHSALRLADEFPATDAELIVVDNDSSDATAEVARDYGARVVAEPRRGISRARNCGAAAATGELLIFVDADYRVPLRFLPAIASRFDRDPALTAAGTRVALEPAEIDPITRGVARVALRLLCDVKSMSFGVFVLRRGYFAEIRGFNENSYAFEDVEILERVLADERSGAAKYRILRDVTVHASARGFYRGGMLHSYARMAISKRARADRAKCSYWYER